MERLRYRHLYRYSSRCTTLYHARISFSCIDPKFADDFSSIANAEIMKEVETILHSSVNQLAKCADNNNTILNELKIKVMLFGNTVTGNELSVKVNNKDIEQNLLFTYLGVPFDTKLSFIKHMNQ